MTDTPTTGRLWVYCTHCNGTGTISLTNGPLPAVEVPCVFCGGTGKLLFGEYEVLG